MFRNREDAARQLAGKLKGRGLRDLLVLAIPSGGIITGAVLARALDAELDVVLSRKLRAPGQPDLVLGAISEDGQVYLNPGAKDVLPLTEEYLAEERRRQLAEIARRQQLFRGVRPPARIEGRTVILTDDGIATGSTMIAALKVVRAQKPRDLIVAVPVAPADRLEEIHRYCDELVWLLSPDLFRVIDEFYEGFPPVNDAQVLDFLCQSAPAS
jgi:predicted phosphoribosyltransferase